MVTGSVLLAALGLVAAMLWRPDPRLSFAALTTFVLLIPASTIYNCDEGWPRRWMAAATIALGLLIPVVYHQSVTIKGDRWLSDVGYGAQQALIFGLIRSQFLGNYLAGAKVRW